MVWCISVVSAAAKSASLNTFRFVGKIPVLEKPETALLPYSKLLQIVLTVEIVRLLYQDYFSAKYLLLECKMCSVDSLHSHLKIVIYGCNEVENSR